MQRGNFTLNLVAVIYIGENVMDLFCGLESFGPLYTWSVTVFFFFNRYTFIWKLKFKIAAVLGEKSSVLSHCCLELQYKLETKGQWRQSHDLRAIWPVADIGYAFSLSL